MASENTVQIGSIALPMADALALYRERSAAWRETLSDAAHVEAVAVWNAIQFADKIAKGIPCRLVTSPSLRAAIARLEAELAGAPAQRVAA